MGVFDAYAGTGYEFTEVRKKKIKLNHNKLEKRLNQNVHRFGKGQKKQKKTLLFVCSTSGRHSGGPVVSTVRLTTRIPTEAFLCAVSHFLSASVRLLLG